MRIGFDVDGVLANFNAAYMRLVTEVTGRNLFPKDYEPHTWNYPETFGYTKDEVTETWRRIGLDPEFWYRLSPLPGAYTLQDNWRKILDAGHDVVFATARPGLNPEMQTAAWLRNVGVTYTDVTVTNGKGPFCLDRYVDCYIDDKLENIQDVVKTSPATRAYLLDRAYNAADDFPRRYVRVPTVEAFFVAEGLL
jgi:FMN phosphatase YigB (HAD superfamily)